LTRKGPLRRRFSRARDWALRHPVLVTLIAALAIRLAAAVFITTVVGFDRPEFSDVATYDRLATERADGSYHDWTPRSELFYDRFGTYVVPLSILYRAFGPHLFFGQLLAALAGAATAALICRLLLMVTAARWALLGGAVVAFMPSQVVWSSTAFRDSFIWMVTAAMALACAVAARTCGRKLLGLGAALALLVFLLGHLRWSTMIVAGCALVIAAVFSLRADRLARVVGAAVIALLVPWYVGAGPAGLQYVARDSPAQIRAQRTIGADSAIRGATRADVTHFPRGLTVVLLEPFPGTTFTGASVRLAQLELVVWYPLLLVALVGIPEAFRRRRVLAFSIVTGGALVVVYALSEGNFGTAFRHRGELVPPTAVLAALGAPTILRLWREHQRDAPARDPVTADPR
jgi:hypothetical protein